MGRHRSSSSKHGHGEWEQPSAIHGYQVLRPLGRGAASRLFAVFEPGSRQVYALKWVVKREERDQRYLDQAEREHEISALIDHPAIRRSRRVVRIRPLLRVREILLLLDLVDGEPLDAAACGAAASLRHLAAVCRCVAHLHARGIVHADLKPGNILVGEDGSATLIDLGQACPAGTEKERVQGTPGFMAPEQRERGPLVPETDVFSLGATLLQSLLASIAPGDETPRGAALATLASHRAQAHDRLLMLGAGGDLARLVSSMLDPVPGRRPRDLEGIAADLSQAAGRFASTLSAAA